MVATNCQHPASPDLGVSPDPSPVGSLSVDQTLNEMGAASSLITAPVQGLHQLSKLCGLTLTKTLRRAQSLLLDN